MKKMRTDWIKRALATALTAAMLLGSAPALASTVPKERTTTEKQIWSFEDNTSFLGAEASKSGEVTMTAKVGSKRLEVSGTHSGQAAAEIYHTLYSNLNISVTAGTRLSYHIEPQQANSGYDYNFYSMHMAVDLKFSDGTYLSDLAVEDQNRVLTDPNSQGEALAVVYEQDNLITINVGEQAKLSGKTITDILVGYANDGQLKAGGGNYKTYIDDIKIEDVAPTFETKADYVSILRGTNDTTSFSRGLTGPMVGVPHGFNFWAPENSSGNKMFDYSEGSINAIRCSHEPSVWIGERGRWTFMPTNGEYGSATYNQETLVAKPHYLNMDFTGGEGKGIKLELTPTDHGMATRITYDKAVTSAVMTFGNLSNLTFDATTKSFKGNTGTGNNGMPEMLVYGTFDTAFTADGSKVQFTKSSDDSTVVNMKVATSFISAEQAKANHAAEVGVGDFDALMAKAKALWNKKLDIIDIEGATEEQLITFYSNMYRLFLYPNSMGEKTGLGSEEGWQYRSPHGDHTVSDGKLYYNNGFWDTYRTTWAAYSLLTPRSNSEMLVGLLQHFEDSDWIPRWIAPGGSDCMVGTSSDVVFGDAFLRGAELTDEQWEMSYKAALKNAAMSTFANGDGGRDSLDRGIFLGYTPGTDHEKMSWAIESYINDYGIAKLAKAQSDMDAYEYYMSRATNYVHIFQPTENDGHVGWFRGKDEDGNFDSGEVDPIRWRGDYTETNGWNMAFTVPQDGQGLVNLYGSKENLADKLDRFFSTPGEFDVGGYDGTIHEMREAREVKLGQYGHSNQPSHHIPYMYLYAGRPDRTQEVVRDVLRQCYVGSRIGQGYIGDEDNGEMSAWYLFSAMGLFPLNMGSGELVIGSPIFTKVTITPEGSENSIIISAPGTSRENLYVNGVTINRVPYDSTSILQTALTAPLATGDVTVVFDMQSTPSSWGKNNPPGSITEGDKIAAPLQDRTIKDTAILKAAPNAPVKSPSAYSANSDSLGSIFDNNSKSGDILTPVSGTASVFYAFPEPTAVSLYTLTSGYDKSKAPANFALFGSNDGQTWTKMDERTGVTFDWKTYTKPFATQTPDFVKFQYYRLDIFGSGAVEVAELELMSSNEPPMNKETLGGLILVAKEKQATLTTAGQTHLAELLGVPITAAETVASNEAATTEDIRRVCLALTNLSGTIDSLLAKLEQVKSIEIENLPPVIKRSLTAAIAAAESATAEGAAEQLTAALETLQAVQADVAIYDTVSAKIAEAKAVDTSGKPTEFAVMLTTAIQTAEGLKTNETATMQDIQAAFDALEQAMKLCAIDVSPGYERIEAESFDDCKSISIDKNVSEASGNKNIGGVNPGDWVKFENVYFSRKGANKLDLRYSAANDGGGYVDVRLDSLDNDAVTRVATPATGGWREFATVSAELDPTITGVHDVYLYFVTGGNDYVANVDYITFFELIPTTGAINGAFDKAALPETSLDGVSVSLYAEGALENVLKTATVDDEQTFSFTGLTPGSYIVKVSENWGKYLAAQTTVEVDEVVVDAAIVLMAHPAGDRQDAEVTAAIDDWTYGNVASVPNCTKTNGNDGTWTYTYTARNNTQYTDSETAPTDAGEYTLTAVYEAAVYEAAVYYGIDTADFTIEKAARSLIVTSEGNTPVLLPNETLTEMDTYQIEAATNTDQDDSAVIHYTSDKAGVVTVDENGLASAGAFNGSATIGVKIPETANYLAAETEVKISALPMPLLGIDVEGGDGETLYTSATVEGNTVSIVGVMKAGAALRMSTIVSSAEEIAGVSEVAGKVNMETAQETVELTEPETRPETEPGTDTVPVPDTEPATEDEPVDEAEPATEIKSSAVTEPEVEVTPLAAPPAEMETEIEIPATGKILSDTATVSITLEGDTSVKRTYEYTIDTSGITTLPDTVDVDHGGSETNRGDTELNDYDFDVTMEEGNLVGAGMSQEVLDKAAELIKTGIVDSVTIKLYPSITAVDYVENMRFAANIDIMYQFNDGKNDIGVARPVETLSTPVRLTVELPSGFPTDSLRVIHHLDDGGAEKLAYTLDGREVTFVANSFSNFEFTAESNVAVDVNFTHYNGSTESRAYSIDDLNSALPTDNRSGYTFNGWTINGKVYKTVTAGLLALNTTVDAIPSFTVIDDGGYVPPPVTSYTIKVTTGEGGTVSPTGTVRVDKGDDKTFRFTALKDWQIADVLVDGKSVGVLSEYTFENVRTTHTLEVRFEKMGEKPVVVINFTDVAEDDWFYDAVCFVTGRGIFNGTSEDSFSPEMGMSRAMLVTALARLDGQDTTKGDQWDAVGVAWAKEQGISDGSSLESAVSREQLAVMLYRYAKAEKVEADLKNFSDAGSVSNWAAEAMTWAVKNSIIIGKGGVLDSQGNASRAEVAIMLERFMNWLVK